MTAADPATTPPSSPVRLAIAGVLVLALVGSLVWLTVGLVAAATEDDTARSEREAVMLRTREYVRAAWNYGQADLDDQGRLTDYRDRVTPLITTSFGTEFEQSLPVLQQLVAEESFARTTTVDHVGVESLDPDSAEVIVSGRIAESQGDQQLAPTPFLWSIDLEKVDGRWLVSDLSGYGGEQ